MNMLPLVFSSFKEIVRQPFYYVILASGCVIILLSFLFTFFAFGEEARMIRDMGVSTITICGLLAGSLSSSILIKGEFERKTVLSIVCKPIARKDFILGRYLGILAAATVLILSQGMVLEVSLLIKKYSGFPDGSIGCKQLIDFACLAGICFSVLQVSILTSISLNLSLYFNSVANLTICFLFFIFCNAFHSFIPMHSTDLMNTVSALIHVVFPDFQNMNMVSLIEFATESYRSNTPNTLYIQYIVYNILYCTIYSTLCVWLAISLFKRKELA